MEAFLGTLWMSFTDFFLFRQKKNHLKTTA